MVNITIHHTKVSGTQTGFPVLISLISDTGLSAHAESDGHDILFTDSNGMKLPHEIESYSGGTLTAWVKVPSVSSATDTTIVMYYGNPSASSQQNPTTVWDVNYKGVWHLKEGTDLTNADSTMNANNGAPQNSPTQAAGQVDGSLDFDYGLNQFVNITGIESDDTTLNLSTSMTISGWAKTSLTDTQSRPIAAKWKTGPPDGRNYWLGKIWTGSAHELDFYVDGSEKVGIAWNLADGAWHHVVGVADATNHQLILYVDGVQKNTAAYTGTSVVGAITLQIGASPDDPSHWQVWSGGLDEVRVLGTARSASWIETEFNNQKSPSTFYSVGTEEGSTCGAMTTFAPCTWGYRKKITIDHTKVSGTQSDFPVLVSLASDTGLSAHARSDGHDIVFTSSDGTTKLSHEIESYSSGSLTAWVKVPSLSSGSDTDIYLYYGNPSSSNQQDTFNVWDANYVGVWHLQESGSGAQGEYKDSTSNADHGQGGGENWPDTRYVPARVAGQIGYGQNFSNVDGKWDYIDTGSNPVLEVLGNQITLEAWVKHDVSNGRGGGNPYGILSHKGWDNGYRIVMDGDPGGPCASNLDCVEFQLPGATYQARSTAVLSANTWHHVAGTYNGSWMAVFIDGQVDANMTAKADAITPSNTGEKAMWIGHADHPAGVPWSGEWEGQLDEVRISKVGRSDSWVRTEYNNMNSPGTFYSVGSEEASPCVTPTPTPTPAWYDCGWGYQKSITIDHTKVSGTQTDFPVLVSLLVSLSSDSDLSARAQSDGDDILFTAADGTTKLSHEIESYSSGTLVAWVKVPSVSSAADTTIMMYYGNAGATSQQNQTGVWDGNYRAVWHLKEDPSGTAPQMKDSKNTNHGTSYGSMTSGDQVSGKMGGSLDLDGGDDRISVGSIVGDSAAFTVSLWFKTSSSNTPMKIWGEGNTGTNTPFNYLDVSETVVGDVEYCVRDDSNVAGCPTYSGGLNNGVWHYFVGVQRAKNDRELFVDGSSRGTSTTSLGTVTLNVGNIGAMQRMALTHFFTGGVDEVRISNSGRSSTWIATEWNNQNSPSTFYSVGSQVASGCPSPPAWDPCSWDYRKKITIDKTKVSGTQTDFPVLVSLASDSDLASKAQGDGDDIVFTSSDG
ncbi:MAG: DUF2341 domain-containing protein, partial [Methanomicrobiales archaeon]|nr:DUF2341 domain-containing protein [Methanomicrobiales archaeon]